MHPAQPWDGLQGALSLPPSRFPYVVLLKAGRLADTAQRFRQLNPLSGETDPGPCRVEATLLGAGTAPRHDSCIPSSRKPPLFSQWAGVEGERAGLSLS